VIVGENTCAACPGMAFQALDAVRVKGKNEPVLIYAPWGEKDTLGEAKAHALNTWNTMLSQFKSQQWEQAQQTLEHWRNMVGDFETLYALYKARIAHFKDNPPPLDWDGVTQFDTK